MEIVVFGAGSLGSLIGGLLARTHDVTLVGRPAHMQAVSEHGLTVGGAVETEVMPRSTTDGKELSGELAVVTVKAKDTETAAAALSTGEFEAVCSLQNGFTEETLASMLSVPVVAGTTTYGARLREPGRVDCTGRGTITVGAYTDDKASAVDECAEWIAEAFRAAGIETVVADEMARRRWEKLAINAAINPITALTRVENGAVVDDPLWAIASAAARETAAVARTEGIELSDETVVEQLRQVCLSTAANRSSMLQDVEAGRETEIEAVTGTVVRRGDKYGVDVATNRLLMGLVSGLENTQEP